MSPNSVGQPDHTAVRVALWRALHVELDAPPHVLDDTLGLKLVAPPEDWRQRRDMDPQFSLRMRASIVARARFVEDLVPRFQQYVILGAGLDTFALRNPGSAVRVFEVERPETQEWKRERLRALGLSSAARYVPVNFEAGWWQQVVDAGVSLLEPTVVSSLGVSMYLTREAITAMLRNVASLAAGSAFVMTFIVPPELMEPEERPGFEAAMRGAAAAGTPFISLLEPGELVALARAAGFKDAQHVGPEELEKRYFAGRTDGLRPGGEHILVATV